MKLRAFRLNELALASVAVIMLAASLAWIEISLGKRIDSPQTTVPKIVTMISLALLVLSCWRSSFLLFTKAITFRKAILSVGLVIGFQFALLGYWSFVAGQQLRYVILDCAVSLIFSAVSAFLMVISIGGVFSSNFDAADRR